MSAVAEAMTGVGVATLAGGLLLARQRAGAESGAGRMVALGPVFEACALAMFGTLHFMAARDLMGLVPKWLPGPLFWTYVVGAGLLAAAVSLVTWRAIRWSAPLLALLFVTIVVTIDLPNVSRLVHERLFWTLTVRETVFAAGAAVLAGSVWRAPRVVTVGRWVVAATFFFYGAQHFLFPRFVPGVPLDKMTPGWIPAPVAISYAVGGVLVVAGGGLLARRTARLAAACAGAVLVGLVAFFYVPILVTEWKTPLALDGVNYVGDTLLFAGTALLAGFE